MAWNRTYDSTDEEANKLIYDLRQIYAHTILGKTFETLKVARATENFPVWFRILKRDLRTEISFKLTDDELKELNEKIEQTKEVLYKHSNTYLGKNQQADEYEIIEEALCQLETHMLRLMEEHKMFGGASDYDEDEI
jgi:hypothetical protein